jgi:hypothetical protein
VRVEGAGPPESWTRERRVKGGERVGREAEIREDKMLNKKPIFTSKYTASMIQPWPPSAAPQTPETLTRNPNVAKKKKMKKSEKKNPRWYACSHPKMATLYNGAPPLLL